MNHWTIGQLAKKAQVSIETIRYYERRGLLPETSRRQSGYRQYSEDALARIWFIKRAKALGFSLREISELLSVQADLDNTCADVKRRAEAKIAGTQERIKILQKIKRELVKLTASCQGRRPISECPILEALYP